MDDGAAREKRSRPGLSYFHRAARQLYTELPNSEFPIFERINFGVFTTLFLDLLLTLNPVPHQDFTAPILFDLGWGFPQL